MKLHRGVLIALVLGMTALACSIPGLPTASSSPPTPDTRLERMVAETVSAALETTQQAEPTPTEEIPPSPAPTVTLAPTATPSAESVLDMNTDGSYTFVDLLAKYQLTVPMQWLAMRINAPEIDIVSQLPETASPAVQRSLTTIKAQDPNVFRLFMLDVAEEHLTEGFVTNVNLVWDRQMEVSLENDTDIKGIAAALPASLKDTEVTGTELKTTKNGIPYGVITAKTPALTQEGVQIVVMQKLVYLNLSVGTLNITLSTTETWRETVEPSFDEIIESFILLQ
jgi:hypothetical protein